MSPEKATLDQLTNEYENAMKVAEKYVFFVRESEQQIGQAEILLRLKDRIRGFKYGARNAGDECGANELFHLQCGLNAMNSFLNMWVDLKKGDYQSAWNKLIDAEEYLSVAMKARKPGPALELFLERLREVERVIFPGFRVFCSAGLLIRGGDCSICGQPFNLCEHIEGRVYWGCLCRRVNSKIVEVDHVAMVDEPRDRRCIMTEITTEDGFKRDCMTWKKIGEAEKSDEKMTVSGVIYRFGRIETD